MPSKIRAILTGLVIVLALAAQFFRDAIALGAGPGLVFALAGAMVVALWLFPEFKREAGGR